jgi:serpin B
MEYEMSAKALIALIFMMLVILSAIKIVFPQSAEEIASIDAIDRAVGKANNEFGFKLFSGIVKEDFGDNIFISPLSASMALAMTYNGARGETQKGMAEALSIENININELNKSYQNLKKVLEESDPKVKLTISNSLWARKGMKFKDEFLTVNKNYFDAYLEYLNFGDPNATNIINKWVDKSTNGLIEKIVEKIPGNAILYLINAIYFKGKWTKQFDKKLTTERTFHLLEGSKNHPMMSQSGKYQYLATPSFQAVRLPYGNKQFGLYIFLPSESSYIKDFLREVNIDNWQTWIKEFRYMDGDIVIPRFKLEWEKSLASNRWQAYLSPLEWPKHSTRIQQILVVC